MDAPYDGLYKVENNFDYNYIKNKKATEFIERDQEIRIRERIKDKFSISRFIISERN